MRYFAKTPKRAYPHGTLIVHNFPPGNWDGDPKVQGGYQHDSKRALGDGGFRAWITDKLEPMQQRCFCGWADGREHYSTYGAVPRDDDASRASR